MSTSSVSLTNLSGGNEIGANSYLLELGRCRVVLDCGAHPKKDGQDALPDLSLLDFDTLEAIFLTHAHLDHAGALPVLMREQPGARVFMSEATRELVDAMLHNSVNVMTSKREELDLPEYPFYTHRELDRVFERWEALPANRPIRFSSVEDVRCEFYHAGHILGAVAPVLDYAGRRILYTGDVHFEDQTLTKAANLPDSDIDTAIVETTRGAAERSADYTREAEIEKLAASIRRILSRGGSVLMPVFAMGKTQELLLILHQLKLEGRLPNAPIHIGGLSTKMTTIYDRLAARAHRHHAGFRIMERVDLIVSSKRKAKRQIQYNPGCIYALSSGMMTENTASNDFAKHFIPNPQNGILFIGYADPASPAGGILAAEPGDPIRLHDRSKPLPLRCDIEKFDFSGHATRKSIVKYLTRLKPRNVVLVHGDEDALKWFETTLHMQLPDSRIIIPNPGQRVDLS